MRFTSPKYIEEIAAELKRNFQGPVKHIVYGLSEINRVETGDLIFVDHPKYFARALSSKANTIIINQKWLGVTSMETKKRVIEQI